MFFFKHLKEKKVGYFTHCIVSLNISKSFIIGGIKAFIHAFIPFWYTTSSTDCIKEMQWFMNEMYNDKSDD
tara:strand:+ start:6376 stop:6588 length:213 start_codon:yes stop_codon:yes gene_type:complete